MPYKPKIKIKQNRKSKKDSKEKKCPNNQDKKLKVNHIKVNHISSQIITYQECFAMSEIINRASVGC